MTIETQTSTADENTEVSVEERFSILEEKINALSRLMMLMLIFVFSVTLALFVFHWTGHVLSHPL